MKTFVLSNLPVTLLTSFLLFGTIAPAQITPGMHEDFQGYPPGSVTIIQTDTYTADTFPIPGFIPLAGVGLNRPSAQDLDYTLWNTEGLVRWWIGRVDNIGSGSRPRRLIYVGADPENNPYNWSNYIVRTTFEINDTSLNHNIMLMARQQEDTDGNQGTGYAAVWHQRPGGMHAYQLLILTNSFDDLTWDNGIGILAASGEGHPASFETLYTMEFKVWGTMLKASVYEGTNLTAPGALKLTVSATDNIYDCGTVAIGLRAGTVGRNVYFHQLTVTPPPPQGSLFYIY